MVALAVFVNLTSIRIERHKMTVNQMGKDAFSCRLPCLIDHRSGLADLF